MDSSVMVFPPSVMDRPSTPGSSSWSWFRSSGMGNSQESVGPVSGSQPPNTVSCSPSGVFR